MHIAMHTLYNDEIFQIFLHGQHPYSCGDIICSCLANNRAVLQHILMAPNIEPGNQKP